MGREENPEGYDESERAGDRAGIRRLIGVYNAEGSVRGELAYWVNARLGRTHCSLCDITHGSVRERRGWRDCRAELPVPFDTFHLDDQPESVRSVVAGRTPAVVADTDQGLIVLLGPVELDRCQGSPAHLGAAIHSAAQVNGLDWL